MDMTRVMPTAFIRITALAFHRKPLSLRLPKAGSVPSCPRPYTTRDEQDVLQSSQPKTYPNETPKSDSNKAPDMHSIQSIMKIPHYQE